MNYKVILMELGLDKFFVIYTLDEFNVTDETDEAYSCDVMIHVLMVAPTAKLSKNYTQTDILRHSEKAILDHETGLNSVRESIPVERIFNKELH